MNSKTFFAILTTVISSSCGILGGHRDTVNRDPEFQSRTIAGLSNSKIARTMDSLFREIDSAPVAIPEDLSTSTLIVETYGYEDFLKTLDNKFHTHKDDKQSRRYYEKYKRKKNTLINNPRYKISYVDKAEWHVLDVENHRYVLKTTNRVSYDPAHLVVDDEGFVYPYVSSVVYYLYDRKTQNVFKEIVDLSLLSKL